MITTVNTCIDRSPIFALVCVGRLSRTDAPERGYEIECIRSWKAGRFVSHLRGVGEAVHEKERRGYIDP
jgi:hypothetical protein